MRYVFIINPKAGKRNPYKTYGKKIKNICKKQKLDYKIVLTEYPGHATEIARAEAEKGDVKILVCGGDGTLFEAANGVIGCENAHIGVIPCGSGNDYIKSFHGADFTDLEGIILGQPRRVDVIKSDDQYSLNICSVGIDAEVAKKMVKFKRLPLVSGKMAYTIALVGVLFGKIFKHYKIEIDGEVFEESFTLALAASGECYGGGYWGAKGALTDDGLLNFVLVKKVSLLKVSKLLSQYKRGEHIGNSEFEKYMYFRQGKSMKVDCKDGTVLNVDGECRKVTHTEMTIIPSAISFIVPTVKKEQNNSDGLLVTAEK